MCARQNRTKSGFLNTLTSTISMRTLVREPPTLSRSVSSSGSITDLGMLRWLATMEPRGRGCEESLQAT